MKIIGTYRDGGTVHARDNEGRNYFLSCRIGHPSHGKLFNEYPEDSSTPIEDDDDMIAASITLAAFRERWKK